MFIKVQPHFKRMFRDVAVAQSPKSVEVSAKYRVIRQAGSRKNHFAHFSDGAAGVTGLLLKKVICSTIFNASF